MKPTDPIQVFDCPKPDCETPLAWVKRGQDWVMVRRDETDLATDNEGWVQVTDSTPRCTGDSATCPICTPVIIEQVEEYAD